MIGMVAGCAAPVTLECEDDAPLCAVAEILAESRDRAADVGIAKVALYQGVESILMQQRDDPISDVAIVTGRDALIRVFVEPGDDFEPREIGARFYIHHGGQIIGAGEGRARIDGPSEQAELESTLNVPISGTMLPEAELSWSVELVEVVDRPPRGSTSAALYPAQGTAALPTLPIGGPMQVYLMPISWDHDGSGRLPDTSAESLATYHTTLRSIFPAAGLELHLEEPMSWDRSVAPNGAGWSELLNRVLEERWIRGIPGDAYLYGLFRPGDTEVGGIAGLSLLAMLPEHSAGRASIGLAMHPGGGAGTMAHEVGHAAGRSHAPCGGAAGSDPNYPHQDAHLGSWGYHPAEERLFDPDVFHDFMSYCGPGWVSDFHWNLLAERQAGIYQYYHGQSTARARTRVWQTAWLHPDGRIEAWEPVALADPPGLEDHVIEVEIDGAPQVVQARLAPFSHLDGGLLYLPTAQLPHRITWRGTSTRVAF
ncbi:MAG: hypothetical protein EA397_11765 [Deltaproteobacteria bacterium]|nr:MAG: hypothetical protein EA397_11765 [Deltaproteobacteria bacterium]